VPQLSGGLQSLSPNSLDTDAGTMLADEGLSLWATDFARLQDGVWLNEEIINASLRGVLFPQQVTLAGPGARYTAKHPPHSMVLFVLYNEHERHLVKSSSPPQDT
jgi:hypothetical protein